MELTLDEQCDRVLKPNQTEICRNPECHFTPIVQILSPNIAGKKGKRFFFLKTKYFLSWAGLFGQTRCPM